MHKFFFAFFLCLIVSLSIFAQQTSTKKIDHLTVEEDDLVRETETLDQRIEVFVIALDRRFQSLSGAKATAAATTKDKKKDKLVERFGALPIGTRFELLADVNSILAEAIVKIDDAAERDKKNPQILKALKILADACSRFVVELKAYDVSGNTEKEREAVADAMQNCLEVIEANRAQSGN